MQEFVESFGLVYSPDYLKPLFRIVTLYIVGLITLNLVDTILAILQAPTSVAAGG